MSSQLSLLTVSVVLALHNPILHATELNFNFLQGGAQIATAAWENLNSKYTPGRYLVDVSLNNKELGKRVVTVGNEDKEELCLTDEWLQGAGIAINTGFYTEVFDSQRQCYVLSKGLSTYVDFDFATQSIYFLLPQKGLLRRSAVRPDWDYGISAVRFNYNANANVNDVDTTFYGSAGVTANVEKWVATTSINASQDSVNVPMMTATRALQGLKADLTVGKTFVSNSLAGGASLLGVGLTSNSSMSPNDLGYTPIFSGVARTNARVALTQNGNTVYSEMVSPGPFEIKNVNLLSSGDVTMTVTESDGSVATQLFPLTIVPNMLSPGEAEYDVYAGLRGDDGEGRQLQGLFTAASYGYGFEHYTLKSSALLHQKYANVGAAVVSGLGDWGTISAQGAYVYGVYDDNSTRSGGKVSLTYAKTLNRDTSLQLVGAQYTSANYIEFSEFNPWEFNDIRRQQQRNQYELSVTHNLTDDIGMDFSGWQRRYWGDNEKSIGFTGNLSARFNRFSLGVGGTYSQAGNDKGYSASVSISIPFDALDKKYNSYASVSVTDKGSASVNSGISSTIGDNFDYSASMGWAHPDGEQTYSLQSSYRGDRALMRAQIAQAGDRLTGSASVSGSAIVLPTKRDVLFTRNTTDTIVIANVEDTEGVKFISSPYPTNSKGNAVIPVSSYNVNNITLDGSTLPINQELLTTSEEVVPTGSSVVYVPFGTVEVKRYLLQIRDKKGQFVSNGTWAMSASGAPLGFITQNGVLFISAIDKPSGLILGNCTVKGEAIKETQELQEVTCEN